MRIPVPSRPRLGCTALVKAHCTPRSQVSPSVIAAGDPSRGWATAGSEATLRLPPSSRASFSHPTHPAPTPPWVAAAEGIRLQGSKGRHRGLRRPLLAERRRAAPASAARQGGGLRCRRGWPCGAQDDVTGEKGSESPARALARPGARAETRPQEPGTMAGSERNVAWLQHPCPSVVLDGGPTERSGPGAG